MMGRFGKVCRGLLGLVVILAAMNGAAMAAPRGDFPLGQTAGGAVCSAMLDLSDPVGQVGTKAWGIHCLGFEGMFGHLYVFTRDADEALAPRGAWQQALNQRADCPASQPTDMPGLSGVLASACKFHGGGLAYSAYAVRDGGRAAAADGLDSIKSLVLLGLKIVLDKAPVPQSALQAAGGPADAGDLDAARSALLQASDSLRTRGHLENKGWQFVDAERDFREYASSEKLTPRDRVAARFDIALNMSNQGPDHFAQADSLFADANAEAGKLHDPMMDALALNYKSLHLLNQRRFAEAIAAARQAIALRKTINPAMMAVGAEPALSGSPDGGIQISGALADSLNTRAGTVGFRIVQFTAVERMAIQDAQAYYVIGAATDRRGDSAAARKSYNQAVQILSAGRLARARSIGWLSAEIHAALGDLDLDAHQPQSARAEYQTAINIFDSVPTLIATPAEANLYFDRGRAAAMAQQDDTALADYKKGFDLHRRAHEPLGDARNLAGPYFDILLARIAADPTHANAWQQDYFDATQVIAGQGTAQTLAELAAGASGSDPLAAQYARALKEKRRDIAIWEETLYHMQDTGTDTPEQRAEGEAKLKAAQAEAAALESQLLDKNPKYGQVVEETASLDGLKAALRSGEVYVKTVFLGNRGYGLAVTHDSVTAYPIALTRVQAAKEVADLRAPFDGTLVFFDAQRSRNLFKTVFGPAQATVQSAAHLIYEPDSVMVALPAATFVTDDASVAQYLQARAESIRQSRAAKTGVNVNIYQGTAWLGRKTDISLTVSAEAFLHARIDLKPSMRPRGFLAFGDPVTQGPDPRRYGLLTDSRYGADPRACGILRTELASRGLPSLKEVDDSIGTIGGLYGAGRNDIVRGQAFSDDAVMERRDLNQYRIVFFGTHGLLPSDTACLPMPALVTSLGSAGKDSDGFLDATEIVKLDLDADMVVLAACNTGTSTDRTGSTGLGGSGDALNGLACDFIYAGARSLLVSQWEVDIAATANLMTGTLGSDAASQAGALRQAEVALMDNPEKSHPYYWAGFSVVGDGGKALPRRGAQTASR